MTKKRKPSEPSEFALQLQRQRAADAMLASGQAVTTLTARRIVEIIEAAGARAAGSRSEAIPRRLYPSAATAAAGVIPFRMSSTTLFQSAAREELRIF